MKKITLVFTEGNFSDIIHNATPKEPSLGELEEILMEKGSSIRGLIREFPFRGVTTGEVERIGNHPSILTARVVVD
jgi:hypothetical protein